uniref:Uncharacterized protein n=1 Tax=Arundo donax TaxID=35708 RepID=A0A0A9BWJ5_ARUDO
MFSLSMLPLLVPCRKIIICCLCFQLSEVHLHLIIVLSSKLKF